MLSKRVRVVGEKEWRIFEFEDEERGLGASANQEGVWGGTYMSKRDRRGYKKAKTSVLKALVPGTKGYPAVEKSCTTPLLPVSL